MSTITIDRSLLEQALTLLSAPNHRIFSEPKICLELRAALAAPATAPEPICTKCGDVITAHDPGLCGCCLSTRDATAPSWKDAPTCAELWVTDYSVPGVVRIKWEPLYSQAEIDRLQAQLVRQQASYEAEIKVEIDAALERAAEVCDGIGEGNKWSDAHGCSNAIRALKGPTS